VSGLIGAALPVTIHVVDDQRLVEIQPWLDRSFPIEPIAAQWSQERDQLGGETFDFRSDWWPAGSGLVSDGGISDVIMGYGAFDPYPVSGCNGRLAFNGVTRDQYGSPLGGCTVRCYRTSTHELQSVVTSDANGAYIATSPYGDSHFLVVHGTGVAGASIDTVVPT
jgi:hypothetical protein